MATGHNHGSVTFTANAGSTFGITNTTATCRAAASCPFKLWVVGINTGSGLALGVVALTNASGVLPLNDGLLQTTTACNACINATALGTIYSTTAQAAKPIVILGYFEWSSGLATAGTYASNATIQQTMGIGIRKPGEVVQTISPLFGSITTVSPTGTTFAGGLTTNLTASITPTMASNLIKFSMSMSGTNSAATSNSFCQAAQGGTPTAVGRISKGNTSAASAAMDFNVFGYDTPGATSSQTYALRCFVSGGTGTFPAVNTDSGFEELQEIMGANDNEKLGLPVLPQAA